MLRLRSPAPRAIATSQLVVIAPHAVAQVWTRLECDAVESAVPGGASALVSSAGQAYEKSTLASYSYGDEAGSDAGANAEAVQPRTPEVLLIGTAVAIALLAVVTVALFFYRRTLLRHRLANRAVAVAKPTAPAPVTATDTAPCHTASFDVSRSLTTAPGSD